MIKVTVQYNDHLVDIHFPCSETTLHSALMEIHAADDRIADGFRNSSGHWRYLGSSEYTYMAVGMTYDSHTAKWYCCVCVSSKNYGG